jgi:GNAT superfamily N-acetyltransferase
VFQTNYMQAQAKLSANDGVRAFRMRYREELNCQIVHDSIHRREGWTVTYVLELEGVAAGFAAIAIGGPWKGKPTFFEFYVLPEYRSRALDLFEAFIRASGARFFEVQSNDVLSTVMALKYGQDIRSEKIVFRDSVTTAHVPDGATLRCMTSEDEIRGCIERQQGGGEWILEVGGKAVATGGILFHYNRPYGDIYMEVTEPFRRRGLGSYLVQELKRVCYELGVIPCARCDTSNHVSFRTLQRAGFVPFAHILIGSIAEIRSMDCR